MTANNTCKRPSDRTLRRLRRANRAGRTDVRQIASEYGVAVSTVYHWWALRGMVDETPSGRATDHSDRYVAQPRRETLQYLLDRYPDMVDVELSARLSPSYRALPRTVCEDRFVLGIPGAPRRLRAEVVAYRTDYPWMSMVDVVTAMRADWWRVDAQAVAKYWDCAPKPVDARGAA